MTTLLKLVHLAAAIVWMGGMAFMLFALRPPLAALPPPQRLVLVAAVLQRFFRLVWLSVGLLLATGAGMMLGVPQAPLGWRTMAAIGLVMAVLFTALFLVPYRRLQRAVAAEDWPAGGAAVPAIARLAMTNFVLGWIAIAAVRLA